MHLKREAERTKDRAEGRRGSVRLRLIRPKQTIGVWPMKVLESVS